jgi:hypothetical protein
VDVTWSLECPLELETVWIKPLLFKWCVHSSNVGAKRATASCLVLGPLAMLRPLKWGISIHLPKNSMVNIGGEEDWQLVLWGTPEIFTCIA